MCPLLTVFRGGTGCIPRQLSPDAELTVFCETHGPIQFFIFPLSSDFLQKTVNSNEKEKKDSKKYGLLVDEIKKIDRKTVFFRSASRVFADGRSNHLTTIPQTGHTGCTVPKNTFAGGHATRQPWPFFLPKNHPAPGRGVAMQGQHGHWLRVCANTKPRQREYARRPATVLSTRSFCVL